MFTPASPLAPPALSCSLSLLSSAPLVLRLAQTALLWPPLLLSLPHLLSPFVPLVHSLSLASILSFLTTLSTFRRLSPSLAPPVQPKARSTMQLPRNSNGGAGPTRLMWAAIALLSAGVCAQGVHHLLTREDQRLAAREAAQAAALEAQVRH